ncbi:MAG: GDP-mannose 4,6-dehydratase [Candidatus Omnitrophota bacterium]|nr:GDP-mannose 4,6-dehydratase [Candidatus Omnitrophota bacterium]
MHTFRKVNVLGTERLARMAAKAGVKANFRSLIKLAGSGLPLPFKGINNRRSFLYVGNLVDAIGVCVEHPKAVGETFLVSDGQDVSTVELIRMIAGEMKATNQVKTRGRVYFSCFKFWKNRNVPYSLLKALCRIVGKGEELDKLTGSLVVDSSKIRNLLGWKAPWTLEEGIRETVRGIEK